MARLRFFAYPLALAPIVFAFVCVAAYGVNVPFLDDWLGTVSLIHRLTSSSLTFSDLFEQYSDHRIFFPRLVMLGLARLTHFNLTAELWTIQAANLVLLAALLVAIRVRGPRVTFLLLVPLISFLVFTPRLQENWFLGFQIVWALVPTFGVLALLLLDLMSAPRYRLALFSGALASATVAGYSALLGLAVWPAGLIQLLLTGRSHSWARRFAVVWSLVGALELGAYFHGFHQVGYSQGFSFNFNHPLKAVDFFVRLLGASLFFTAQPALVGGIILVCAGAATVVLAVRYGEGRANPFWTSVAAFALMMALIVTWGRSGLGPGWALTSRYTDPARLLVLGMLVVLVTMAVSRHSRASAVLGVVVAGLVVASAIVNYPHVLEISREARAHRQWLAWVVATYRQQPDEFLRAAQLPPGVSLPRATFAAQAADLERRRYTVFSSDKKPAPPQGPPPFASTVSNGQPSFCTLDSFGGSTPTNAKRPGPGNRPLTVVGWCRDQRAHDVAGGVYALVDGKPYPLFDRMQRPDVAVYFGSENYLYAGFIGLVPRPRRLAGEHTLQIVALSHDGKQRFVPTPAVGFRLR